MDLVLRKTKGERRMNDQRFEGWAIITINVAGYATLAGMVQDVAMFGARKLRIDLTLPDGESPCVQFYDPQAVLIITPCSVEEAQARAESNLFWLRHRGVRALPAEELPAGRWRIIKVEGEDKMCRYTVDGVLQSLPSEPPSGRRGHSIVADKLDLNTVSGLKEMVGRIRRERAIDPVGKKTWEVWNDAILDPGFTLRSKPFADQYILYERIMVELDRTITLYQWALLDVEEKTRTRWRTGPGPNSVEGLGAFFAIEGDDMNGLGPL